MTRPGRLTAVLLVAPFVAATLALAATLPDVSARASALDSDYRTLVTRLEADTEPHAALKADHVAIEARRAALESDRRALPASCACASLDATIADLGAQAVTAAYDIDAWHN